MKKIFSIILIVLVLISSCMIPVYAQEGDDYDIIVDIAEVIVYDKTIDGVPGEWFEGCLSVNVMFNHIERFDVMYLYLDFNTELMRYESSVEKPERACICGCLPTKTGVVFSARLGEMAEPDTAYSRETTGFIKVSGTGEHNIKIAADVRDKNGDPVDVKVKFKSPYKEVVDVSAVTTINKLALTFVDQYAVTDYKTTVAELIGNKGIGAGAVIDADGNFLDENAKIPNGAYLATLYEGYVVDKIQLCVIEDVNCDAKVTAADARLALRHSARLENLSGVSFYAADVNFDGKVTAADARLILRKPAGLA